MPEHVHLLVSEPERGTLAHAMQSLWQGPASQAAEKLRPLHILGRARLQACPVLPKLWAQSKGKPKGAIKPFILVIHESASAGEESAFRSFYPPGFSRAGDVPKNLSSRPEQDDSRSGWSCGVESLPCFAEALSAVEGEVEGDLLSGFPDIFDYYFDPTAWSSFRHYLNSEAGPVEIEWQWTARKRQQAGIFLTVRARLPAD